MPPETAVLGVEPETRRGRDSFDVHLDIFSGPFDLLLTLIARHKLDITEVALAEVTDEFIAYMRSQEDWDLSTASDFLVVAATLLDLKAARLLPAGTSDETEDIELLEARDLLFARLLQYRAFKQMAALFAVRLETESRFHPRQVTLEAQFAHLLPELIWSLGPSQLAAIAAEVLTRPPAPHEVSTAHLASPTVSVREQADLVAGRLASHSLMTFRALVSDAEGPAVIIARFLALLELFREALVAFDQVTPLGELTIRWTGQERRLALASDYEGEEGE